MSTLALNTVLASMLASYAPAAEPPPVKAAPAPKAPKADKAEAPSDKPPMAITMSPTFPACTEFVRKTTRTVHDNRAEMPFGRRPLTDREIAEEAKTIGCDFSPGLPFGQQSDAARFIARSALHQGKPALRTERVWTVHTAPSVAERETIKRRTDLESRLRLAVETACDLTREASRLAETDPEREVKLVQAAVENERADQIRRDLADFRG